MEAVSRAVRRYPNSRPVELLLLLGLVLPHASVAPGVVALSGRSCSAPVVIGHANDLEVGYQECTGGAIELATAWKSDGRVYLRVTGDGITVNGWETWIYAVVTDGCVAPDAYFYAQHPSRNDPSAVDLWSNPGPCRTAPENGVTRWWARTEDVPAQYVSGTKLCNAWDAPFRGFPCVTIRG